MGIAVSHLMLRASTQPRWVIAGHSHTWALGFPKIHPEGIYGVVPHPFDERFGCMLSPAMRDAQYWREVVRLSKTHAIAVTWQGNQHFREFMFAPPQPIDFAVASRPELPVDETAVLVPELAVRQYYKPTLAELAELLPEMCAAAGPGVILLGPPPPKDDIERQRWQLFDRPGFVEFAAALGGHISTIPFAPELLHLKMWQVITDMLRALAETHGVPFLGAPPEALKPNGFLRDELGAEDLTHANRAYGALVLRDLALLATPTHAPEA